MEVDTNTRTNVIEDVRECLITNVNDSVDADGVVDAGDGVGEHISAVMTVGVPLRVLASAGMIVNVNFSACVNEDVSPVVSVAVALKVSDVASVSAGAIMNEGGSFYLSVEFGLSVNADMNESVVKACV